MKNNHIFSRNFRINVWIAVSAFVLAGWVFPAPSWSAERQVLRRHVPDAVKILKPIARAASTNRLNLAFGLPLRNQEALTNLLQQIYDPASTNFHRYLTPAQFAEKFGPTEQDYQAVSDFAKANGFRVTATHPNRVVLDVEGTVTDTEKAFHLAIQTYKNPVDGRIFFAPETEPSIDLQVPVLYISGMNNYSIPHPKHHRPTAGQQAQIANLSPRTGTGPSGNYMGSDFRTAYVPGTPLTGTGQTVGLLQFDGYNASDITYYATRAGLPNIPLVNVLIDGATGKPSGSGGEVEVCLDIEMAASMAPGLSKIIVYIAPNPSPWVDLLSRMANDNLAKQMSCSWGGGSPDATAEQIFLQMATQGQSFFNATGDSDAFTGAIEFPSDSLNVTQVGGTTLTTSGAGGAWVSETVWNWGGGVGSSGGISTYYTIPAWQQGISMAASKGSTTMRNVPDVAMTADNVYVRADGADSTGTGGTSCAAPLWAGFMALVNQQATASGLSPVGFINPLVYAISKTTNYTSRFHDTTTGNNTSSSSSTKFYAVAGYDLCTGLGTPNGISLINALAGTVPPPVESLIVSPSIGFSLTGPVGGPFSMTAGTFSVTNAGTGSLTWSVSTDAAWLSLSTAGGTLTPGGSVSAVTVSLTTSSGNLPAGVYQGTLLFSNRTSGATQARTVTLSIGQSIVQNGGFETGNFSGFVQSGNTAYTSLDTGTAYAHSGSYGLKAGPATTLGYLTQSLSTMIGQSYRVSCWLDSPDGKTPNQFSLTWNGNVLFNQSNIGTIGWTNLSFVVTATGTSTVLQLGFRDDPSYLGLDDISVVPVAASANPPVITLQPTSQSVLAGSSVTFSSLAQGSSPLAYQWQKNTTNIVGATNANLLLTGVTTAQAGSYRVVITNPYGTATSASATLTVTTSPTYTRIIRLGGSLVFGNVQVGTSAQTTLTVYNDGNTNLNVSGIIYPNGFSGAWSGSIASGGSQNVAVTFLPLNAAGYAGTVSVTSDATSGTGTIPVSGTGTNSTAVINLALASRGSTIRGSNGGGWSALIDGITTGYNSTYGYGYTYWGGRYGTPGKITLDFKSICKISSIKLLLWDGDNRYSRYEIEASRDGTTWSVIVNHTGSQYQDRGWQTLNLATPASARYLRLTGTYSSLDYYFAVVEWEVYGSLATAVTARINTTPANILTPHVSTTPANVSTEPADILTSSGASDYINGWKAFDGNTNTVWQGTAGAGGWWIVSQYDPEIAVSNVVVDYTEGSLTNITCLYSVDAMNWEYMQPPLKNGSVYVKYLWLIFPADNANTDRVPIVREIRTE